MKLDNLQVLIDHIAASPPESVVMNSFVDYHVETPNGDCGTAYCIAGHAAFLQGKINGDFDRYGLDWGQTYRFFGVLGDNATVDRLAYCHDSRTGRSGVTLSEFDALMPARRKEIVLEVLTKLRDTGEVCWGDYAAEVKANYLDSLE